MNEVNILLQFAVKILLLADNPFRYVKKTNKLN